MIRAGLVAIALCAACSSSTTTAPTEPGSGDGGSIADAGSTADAATAGDAGACGPGKHVCVCATGTYCAPSNASCLAPTSPCP